MFRVEEYKKPEFEVKVTRRRRSRGWAKRVTAQITARYYFGAPVAQGHLTYKVFREDYHHVYWGPDEYDWLYGAGYGRDYYPYPWFPWWGRWGVYILGDLWPFDYRWPGGYNGYGGDQAEDGPPQRGERDTARAARARGAG